MRHITKSILVALILLPFGSTHSHSQGTPKAVQTLRIWPSQPGDQAVVGKTTIPNSHSMPPTEFDRFFYGPLEIRVVPSSEELIRQCDGPSITVRSLACTRRFRTKCLIVMLEDDLIRERGWNTGLILRHEMAHCNGWPYDHPGLRAFKE